MTTRFNLFLLALFIAIGVPFYHQMLSDGADEAEAPPLAIEDLRKAANLAETKIDDLPVEISYEEVARGRRVANLLAAGSGMQSFPVSLLVFEVRYRDGSRVMIGPVPNAKEAQRGGYRRYDARAEARVLSGFEEAHATLRLLGPNDADEAVYSPAPGMAIMPLSDTSEGGRLVFVRLVDGREYLFAGAVALIEQSWTMERGPGRGATEQRSAEERTRRRAWLKAINTLADDNPQLVIVPRAQVPPRSGIVRAASQTRP